MTEKAPQQSKPSMLWYVVFSILLAIVLPMLGRVLVLLPTMRAQFDGMKERGVFDRASRANDFKQMGLVLKIYANEHSGKFPVKSTKEGTFYPEESEIWPEYLDDLEELTFIKSETDVQVCYLGYVVRNDEEVFTLLDAFEQKKPEVIQNKDLIIGEGKDEIKIYRIREGVSRYFITDNNNLVASALMESEIPIMWELADTSKDNGGWVLYMDGHVEWLDYPGEFPMTETSTKAIRSRMNTIPEETN